MHEGRRLPIVSIAPGSPLLDHTAPQLMQLIASSTRRVSPSTRSRALQRLRSRPVDMENFEYRDVAISLAKSAGDIIRTAWNKPRSVMNKGAVDLVTETDQACEDLVMNSLADKYPDHAFIGEEGSSTQGFTAELTDKPTWIVDPLDGTTNFVHRFPFVCVCIGLAINKKVVVGVVYNPILEELFVATAGMGATLNGAPISVSPTTELGKAIFATEIGTTRDAETVSAIFDRVAATTSASRAVRCCGSCAMNMCGVAMGRLDAFYEIGFGGPWDVAAAALIVEEAGGLVLDPDGSAFDLMGRRVLVGTPPIALQMGSILAKRAVSTAEPSSALGPEFREPSVLLHD